MSAGVSLLAAEIMRSVVKWGEVAVVGEAEVLHLQPQSTSLETFPDQTEVLYAVEY